MHFHAMEGRRVNGRRALRANVDATSRRLAEAMRQGATIKEQVILAGLRALPRSFDGEAFAASRLSMMRIMARRKNAVTVVA
jgi:hypothetical protein